MDGMVIKQIKKILYIILFVFLLVDETVALAATKAVYEDDGETKEDKVYRGVVNTEGLNVRSAAGHKNPIVQVNGKSVILKKQDEVAVLDKVVVENGKTWYKVSFQRGDTLIVGYVNGNYVDLTTDIVNPLLPEEVSTKLKEQVKTIDSAMGQEEKEKSSSGVEFKWIIIVGISVLIGIFIVYHCIHSQSSKEREYEPVGSLESSSEYSSYTSEYLLPMSSDEPEPISRLTNQDHDELDLVLKHLGEGWGKDL